MGFLRFIGKGVLVLAFMFVWFFIVFMFVVPFLESMENNQDINSALVVIVRIVVMGGLFVGAIWAMRVITHKFDEWMDEKEYGTHKSNSNTSKYNPYNPTVYEQLEEQRRKNEAKIQEAKRIAWQPELERLEKEKVARLRSTLKSKISNAQGWNLLDGSDSFRVYSLYYYYPMSVEGCGDTTRHVVWDFKNNDGSYYKEKDYNNSVDKIVPKFRDLLKYFFKEDTSELTLFCIPPSESYKYICRCSGFSEKLCRATGMKNGYKHMEYVKDGVSKNLNHGDGEFCEVRLDREFWKGRFVVMFDDVITRGDSMMRYKRMLTDCGAYVVCGITIGRTKHTIMNTEPIDDFYENM